MLSLSDKELTGLLLVVQHFKGNQVLFWKSEHLLLLCSSTLSREIRHSSLCVIICDRSTSDICRLLTLLSPILSLGFIIFHNCLCGTAQIFFGHFDKNSFTNLMTVWWWMCGEILGRWLIVPPWPRLGCWQRNGGGLFSHLASVRAFLFSRMLFNFFQNIHGY